jgi:glycine dehydrogenase
MSELTTLPSTGFPSSGSTFLARHVAPKPEHIAAMLAELGVASLAELVEQTVPAAIRLGRRLELPPALSEQEALQELRRVAARNEVWSTFIGQGYYGTLTPPVIQRCILESPAWYTPYTPYQAEIAQGRLEALLNFQTMVADLTGMELANASLLDEGTAAAEAMTLCHKATTDAARTVFWVSDRCHPQTIDVVRTRARPQGIEVRVVADSELAPDGRTFGVLVQYPTTDGEVVDYRALAERTHAAGALLVMATDLLALTLLETPGAVGADVAIGSSQRFGVPMGYGGPHAAFLATRDAFRRLIPGRIVGVSKDARGNTALRLALQTREQHIRRDKATSNICTAQVLLAIMAGMYAVYHGPEGLLRISRRVQQLTASLGATLRHEGLPPLFEAVFDTITVRPKPDQLAAIRARAAAARVNLRYYDDGRVGVSLDETTRPEHITLLVSVLTGRDTAKSTAGATELPEAMRRTSPVLQHPIFRSHHSEHELLRYIYKLQSRDLALTTSMIPLGSCTMKLNAAAEMMPVTWPEICQIHPFAPAEQAAGYAELFAGLEKMLGEITGLPAVSLQPNAGSQGEYAGLLAIRGYHESRGDLSRNVCLIPSSAHGTNPASAVMVGMDVVVVACDERGNVDLQDLRTKAQLHANQLAALMVTYPSTHGVFEESIRVICDIVHQNGGQVYMDGANMNAQVALCRPGDMGVDVCHLNLHKTFCIPHGGGGPGMGPICAAPHLAAFLPQHVLSRGGETAPVGAVSAAPYGSPAILVIPWMYIRMMGAEGLERATQVAILNANYCAKRLEGYFPIVYRGDMGRVAHEFIVDLRGLKKSADVSVADVAKRLMDYGFHAPTVSWPVAGTLMVEPTESEPKAELDRFCDAMIAIWRECKDIEEGKMPKGNNPLVNAPHTASAVVSDTWDRPYSREQAAFPAPWVREHKFWPAVARIDEAYGDRNLQCACPPLTAYES